MTETIKPMDATAHAAPSLYEALGCTKEASSSDLKKAYRKLALQLHPDKNPGDAQAAARFQTVSRAYDVLGDQQKRQFYDNNGLTEEIDVSAEDWMTSFTEMVHEFSGGMPLKRVSEQLSTAHQHVQEMFNGLSAEDLSSMPAFPFPKELFPPDMFPPGLQFSEESLDMLPPSVRELVETGQASSLGLMFEASSEHLEPGIDSLFSLLMGSGNLPGVANTKSKRSSKQDGSVPNGAAPAHFDFEAMSEQLELLSACSEADLMGKLMRGELGLGDVGLGGGMGQMRDALKYFGADELSESSSDSESEQSDPDDPRSKSGTAAQATGQGADSVMSKRVHSDTGTFGGVEQADGNGQPTVLIEEFMEGASGFEAFRTEECGDRGEAITSRSGNSTGVYNHHKESKDSGRKRTDTGSSSLNTSQSYSASVRSGAKKKPNSHLRTQWMAAAKSGHVPSLQAALQGDGALLECQGAGVGHTALHWAAAGGHVDAVRWLVAMGSNPCMLNAVGSTALHAAAAHGHADVLGALLEQSGCDRDIVNVDGDTALQVAQRREHSTCVLLLRQDQAACQSHVHTSSSLNSCTVNKQEPCKASPSHQHQTSSPTQHAPVLGTEDNLISSTSGGAAGAQCITETSLRSFEQLPEGSSTTNMTHIYRAASGESNCEQSAHDAAPSRLLRDANWGQVVSKAQGKAWIQAAKSGDVKVMQELLSRNVVLVAYRGQGTSVGFVGNSALHWAVAKGHCAAARMLLHAGADPNCGNNAGRTPLHSAVCNKQLQLVQLLILEGSADAQARDLDGDTPRDAALSVFGADHDAVKAIDTYSLAAKLRVSAADGNRWQIRDMKALLAAAGVVVVPGCERVDLERQCQESLKGLPQRIQAQHRTAEILNALSHSTINTSQPPGAIAETSTDAFGTDWSAGPVHAPPEQSAGDDMTMKTEAVRTVPKHAAAAKEKGNAAFSSGDFRKAIVQYTMALRMTGESTDDHTSSSAFCSFRAVLFGNRSAAHASSVMWQEALHDAQEALKLDDACAKYWCRKGAAQMGYGRLQDAACSYKQALEVDGSSAAAQAGLDLARSRLLNAR